MSSIVWLASFPKSGNTWVRIFLNNFIADEEQAVSINQLDEGTHAGHRILFDRLIGVPSSDLLPGEIDRLRPALYSAWAEEVEPPFFVKVHDAWRTTAAGDPLFPAEASGMAILIVRNPLDIVPSLANHAGIPIEAAISRLNNPNYALAKETGKLPRQLPQLVGDWSRHTASWLDQTDIPVHLVRYEDLLQDTEHHFCTLIQKVGLPRDHTRLKKAIRFSNFKQLKAAEAQEGFYEKPATSAAFFHSGRMGRWRELLNKDQVNRVVSAHHAMMCRLGYLDEAGNPT